MKEFFIVVLVRILNKDHPLFSASLNKRRALSSKVYMEYEVIRYLYTNIFLLTITCTKSMMETQMQSVKYAQSQ